MGVKIDEVAKIRDFFVDKQLFKANPMYLSYTIDIQRMKSHDRHAYVIVRSHEFFERVDAFYEGFEECHEFYKQYDAEQIKDRIVRFKRKKNKRVDASK